MDHGLAHDPHPNDAEFERLLALHAAARRDYAAANIIPPEGETFNRRREREQRVRIACAEMNRIEQALNDLSFADPDAQPISHTPIEPYLPLLPGPPSWRTSSVTYDGADAEMRLCADAKMRRFPEDDALVRAVEEALVTLARKPVPPLKPRIVAMQIYDHHVARGECLPDHALKLLARAMPIDPRQIEALERRDVIARGEAEGRSQKTIAADLGISTRAVHLLRNRPVPDDVALFAAVAEGKDLRALRPAVAAALDLLKKGRWRTDVLAAIHGGTRNPDLVREAARVEAGRRKAGKEPNNAKLIARAMRVDPRWVERWIARSDWETAVTVEAVWLRGWRGSGLYRVTARVEAQRRLDGKPVNHADEIAAALKSPSRTDPRTVKRMIASPGWEQTVADEAVWLIG